MTITKSEQNGELLLKLDGRLDTSTAPQLEQELSNSLKEEKKLTLDFTDLTYLSSAGLRVLLAAQKKMNERKGTMVVRHVHETIMEVFEITGFTDILTIE